MRRALSTTGTPNTTPKTIAPETPHAANSSDKVAILDGMPGVNGSVVIRLVRNIAPKKNMYCVEFQLDRRLLWGSSLTDSKEDQVVVEDSNADLDKDGCIPLKKRMKQER
mmetsp:Transcript_34760/g.46949  ORF Transcript_34760/g.46949 Transcript_34760/m.46949 type:complete len:110 (-) Transcript_34760:114-443(-)